MSRSSDVGYYEALVVFSSGDCVYHLVCHGDLIVVMLMACQHGGRVHTGLNSLSASQGDALPSIAINYYVSGDSL